MGRRRTRGRSRRRRRSRNRRSTLKNQQMGGFRFF
jgi:hypothetical protein